MLGFYDVYDKSKWIKYYFRKFLPSFFYPFYVEIDYKKCHNNKKINLKSPITFSEKLNYLKIFDVNEEKTTLSDKLLVKAYIKKKIPQLNIAKVYDIAFKFEDLDFDKCPQSFIIKTNHACKTCTYIENKNTLTKQEYNKYKDYYKKVLSVNYAYWSALELQYKNIIPKIYVEEYVKKNSTDKHCEYEVYCLNGKPEFIHYTEDINYKGLFTYINTDWQKTEFNLQEDSFDDVIPNSYNRDKILEYSQILSEGFKFARIDFLEMNNELYFGEITFTPYASQINFFPEKYDKIIGDKLIL